MRRIRWSRLFFHISCTNPIPVNEYRPDLNPALALWIHQLMKKDPLERPQDAGEALRYLEDLENAVLTRQVQAAPATHNRQGRSGSGGGKPWMLGLWIGLPVLLVGALAVWFLSQPKAEQLEAPVAVPIVPVTETVPPEPEPPQVISDPLPQRVESVPEPIQTEPKVEAAFLDPLDTEAVRAAVGQTREVEGRPVRLGENKAGTILYLNFSENFRNTLTLVFFIKDQAPGFGRESLEPYLNKKIRIKAEISEYNGAPQIKVDSLDQMQMVQD
ncbi:MAG: hypothetical protein HC904_00440 [Blastochloris sp.]|nr:hypothetical protein [Blastochloris sp.]